VLPLAQQEAWLRQPGGVVVERAPGRLVAVGALRPATCTGEDDPIAGAVELLVHDAWQRRGIGSTLVEHFAGALLLVGRTELQVHPDADPVAAQALLTGLGARVRGQRHAHGRCPRVHVSRSALDGVGPLRELAGR
jgi:ribosomal protein S18 acetylase RimI-like enzyme